MQTAHNGVPIPHFMYGTAWKKEDTSRYVQLAVQAGFRAIDTANQLIHYHEALVGEALLSLAKQGITRDQLFLQTKFTPVSGQDHRTPYDPIAPIAEQVAQSFESSLEHLHTDSIDSYVLHGPYGRWGLDKEDWEVWAALRKAVSGGPDQNDRDQQRPGPSTSITVRAGQRETHGRAEPLLCGLGMGPRRQGNLPGPSRRLPGIFASHRESRGPFTDPDVGAIAKRCKTGPAQIIFRFAQQVGMLPLTGTTDAQHMKEDLDIERVELSPEEIARIESISV